MILCWFWILELKTLLEFCCVTDSMVGPYNAALHLRFLLKIRFVRILDTIVCSVTLLWLFSPAWDAYARFYVGTRTFPTPPALPPSRPGPPFLPSTPGPLQPRGPAPATEFFPQYRFFRDIRSYTGFFTHLMERGKNLIQKRKLTCCIETTLPVASPRAAPHRTLCPGLKEVAHNECNFVNANIASEQRWLSKCCLNSVVCIPYVVAKMFYTNVEALDTLFKNSLNQ